MPINQGSWSSKAVVPQKLGNVNKLMDELGIKKAASVGVPDVEECDDCSTDCDCVAHATSFVDLQRGRMMTMLEESANKMHDIVHRRMVEDKDAIGAAQSLSDLIRTWEGIARGMEKQQAADRRNAPKPVIPGQPGRKRLVGGSAEDEASQSSDKPVGW